MLFDNKNKQSSNKPQKCHQCDCSPAGVDPQDAPVHAGADPDGGDPVGGEAVPSRPLLPLHPHGARPHQALPPPQDLEPRRARGGESTFQGHFTVIWCA